MPNMSPIARLQRSALVFSCAVLLTLLTGPSALDAGETNAAPGETAAFQNVFADAVARVTPAVVNISKVAEEGKTFRESGKWSELPPVVTVKKIKVVASGFIISADGYILTNNHVVRGATALWVTLPDERKFRARLIGRDARSDIAIIKIDTDAPLPFAPLGDSDKVRAGDWVLAFGSPFGFNHTVTHGIVSAKRRMQVLSRGIINHLIQIDASINQGSSGGPLCNLKGEVIGINNAIYAPKKKGTFSGIGLAIAVNSVKDIADALLRDGKYPRGWLGISVKAVDEAGAHWYRLAEEKGALVTEAVPGSPAAAARLKRGDVIKAVDGATIDTTDDFIAAVTPVKPKDTLRLRIIRHGKEMELRVTAVELPPDEPSL